MLDAYAWQQLAEEWPDRLSIKVRNLGGERAGEGQKALELQPTLAQA
jgi:hypothetical protein